MKSRLPQVALFGVSGYASSYVRWLESDIGRQLVELRAVVVVNQAEEPAVCARLLEMGARLYSNWTDLFQDWAGKLDLCLMPLPLHLHMEAAIAAMEAGANVLLEKPLAIGAAQVSAIREAEQRTGKWVAVGYQDLYRATTGRMHAALCAGRIGAIRHISWVGLWPRPLRYFQRNSWAGRLQVNGIPVLDSPFNNALAHFLNMSLYLAAAGHSSGAPSAQAIGIHAELFRCNEIESFDTGVLSILCDTGVTIAAAATHCSMEHAPVQLQIHGEKGSLTWTQHESIRWSDGEEWPLEDFRVTQQQMMEGVLRRLVIPETEICTSAIAAAQAHLIERLHLNTPISQVDPHFWENRTLANGDQYRCIPGLDAELPVIVQRRTLPSRVGAHWALPMKASFAACA